MKLLDSNNRGFDKVNAAIAGLVFLISFIVYNLTKAPTFSFWDCGEFIASAYILGIPHPPGSPLYVILGRIFSILPIAADIAVRINLLSVFSSAASTLFGYLVTVRLIRFWYAGQSDSRSRLITYIGGFTGALFMAFSNTNWGNSVEAEVYSAAILIMMIIYWFALRYFENKETSPGSRYMALILYLGLLGVGVHLAMYVIVPVLGLYFIMKKEAGSREWAIVAAFFLLELYLIFELSSKPREIPFYIPILITFIIFLFHSAISQKSSRILMMTLGFFLVSLYSLYLAIISAFAKNIFGKDISASLIYLKDIPVGWIGLAALTIWGVIALIKYLPTRTEENSDREWLITAVYSLIPAVLIFVGLIFDGYTAFLALTVLSIAVLGFILRRYINWLILIAVGSISMVILGVWQLVWGLLIGIALVIALGLYFKDKSWKTAVMIIILAAIGYSVHAFIPIRSAQNPSIDENKPSKSLDALVGYLERKQYGSQSMVDRMFVRRGEWVNQFGDFRRMGFWRFFKEQYGFDGPRFFVVLILGLFGIWETIRRKPDIGLPFLALVMVCSIGIVLYMNFADGTRQDPVTLEDYLEVRDRDYFFTPAFAFFGLAIGIGIAAVMELFRDISKNMRPVYQKYLFGLTSIMVLLPLFPLKANYYFNDRSRNFMPYDYANNYLKSCEKGAILITNGDNDTFPLWCIQEVYGVRKDVRVVNLSLSNTPWYLRQVRDRMNVPLDLTNDQINRLRPYQTKDGEVFRIQDQAVEHILTANKWRYPVYMTVTVPDESRHFQGRSLDENLSLEGMAYHLIPIRGKNQINFEKTRRLYFDEFNYRGLGDPSVYKDENAVRLTGNYASGFIMLADTLKKAGDLAGAFEFVKKGLQIMPDSYDLYAYGTQILAQMGRTDTMSAFIRDARTEDKWKLYFNWGISAKVAGRIDDAIQVLELTHQMYPNYADAYRALVALYYQNRNYSKLRVMVIEWVGKHPEDRESQQLLREIQNVSPSDDTAQGSN